jgi:hypothetical protein
MSNYEQDQAEFEHQSNKAANDYYAARSHLVRTEMQENLFRAGFRIAWDYLKAKDTDDGK